MDVTALPPIRLGISSCLLGEQVRFDGGHKRDPFLVQTLGPMVEWVPVCPEVEIGLSTPRESIRLVRDPKALDGVRLVTGKTGVDLTKQMRRYARQRLRDLTTENLSGYVLKPVARGPMTTSDADQERYRNHPEQTKHRQGQTRARPPLDGATPPTDQIRQRPAKRAKHGRPHRRPDETPTVVDKSNDVTTTV